MGPVYMIFWDGKLKTLTGMKLYVDILTHTSIIGHMIVAIVAILVWPNIYRALGALAEYHGFKPQSILS